MPTIAPFRGLLYNPEKVSPQDVVAPPYDVIPPELQARLYERHPYNVVRLILGREEDRYTAAAQAFEAWQQDGILVRDQEPALYLLHQTFDDTKGRIVTRKGFIALCRLEELQSGVVLAHERTLAGPIEDRLKLFKATQSNFSQIFALYSDPEKEIDRLVNGTTKTRPAVDVLYEDVQNTLWRIGERDTISAIQQLMQDKQVLIADGHHRYETALLYRDFMRSQNPNYTGDEAYNFVMMYFTNVEDESLVILPTHRIVHSLPSFSPQQFLSQLDPFFILHDLKDLEALRRGLDSSSTCAFGLIMSGDLRPRLLTLKPSLTVAEVVHEDLPQELKELDVTVFHSLVLSELLGISRAAQEQKLHLEYVKDAEEAVRAVESGRAQFVAIMRPTPIAQVRAVAKAGYTLPQKSTYFHPKLLTGLVMNKLD